MGHAADRRVYQSIRHDRPVGAARTPRFISEHLVEQSAVGAGVVINFSHAAFWNLTFLRFTAARTACSMTPTARRWRLLGLKGGKPTFSRT